MARLLKVIGAFDLDIPNRNFRTEKRLLEQLGIQSDAALPFPFNFGNDVLGHFRRF